MLHHLFYVSQYFNLTKANSGTGTRNKFLYTFTPLVLFVLSCSAFGRLVPVIAGSIDQP